MMNVPNKIDNFGKNLSIYVENQFPAYFLEKESGLIPFLELYYEWLYTSPNPGYNSTVLDRSPEYNKESILFFWETLKSEILYNFPENIVADKYVFAKTIKSFYLSKGTPASFKFLMAVLFNEEITIYYPRDNIFKTSASNWSESEIIKLNGIYLQDPSVIVNRRLYGSVSGASCLIESTSNYSSDIFSSVIVADISNYNGKFLINEVLETRDDFEKIQIPILGQIVEVNGTTLSNGIFPIFNDTGDSCLIKIYNDSITVIDSGQGFLNSTNINEVPIDSISVKIDTSFVLQGKFLDTVGHCSSDSKLQDGIFLQNFSYVIKSNVEFKKYKDLILQLLHPAGTKLFGSIELKNVHTLRQPTLEYNSFPE